MNQLRIIPNDYPLVITNINSSLRGTKQSVDYTLIMWENFNWFTNVKHHSVFTSDCFVPRSDDVAPELIKLIKQVASNG